MEGQGIRFILSRKLSHCQIMMFILAILFLREALMIIIFVSLFSIKDFKT